MLKLTLAAALLSLLPSSASASQPADEALGAPTAAELQQLVQGDWPSFARRIHQQDRVTEAPGSLTSLPQALCRTEIPGTYECVSLVEYRLSGGTQRSSLLRHHVSRDSRGRLLDSILIRETRAPR
jgi:hypothetical protein